LREEPDPGGAAPNPRILPLVQVFCAAAAMGLLAAVLPGEGWRHPLRLPLAFLILAAGFTCAFLGVRAFRRAGTTVDPRQPSAASTLVTRGIYRFSRNPMYLGFLLALGSWALFLGRLESLLVLPLFILSMNRLQIRAEERALRARFGREWERWAARVPRWFGWPGGRGEGP